MVSDRSQRVDRLFESQQVRLVEHDRGAHRAGRWNDLRTTLRTLLNVSSSSRSPVIRRGSTTKNRPSAIHRNSFVSSWPGQVTASDVEQRDHPLRATATSHEECVGELDELLRECLGAPCLAWSGLTQLSMNRRCKAWSRGLAGYPEAARQPRPTTAPTMDASRCELPDLVWPMKPSTTGGPNRP